MHRPQVLFLDEPTTGLDPEVRAEMWDEIARLAGDGLTVLLTTHYLEEADRLAAQLAIVDKGTGRRRGLPRRAQARAARRRDPRRARHERRRGGGAAALGAGRRARRDPLDADATLHARAEDGARTVPAVLAALEAAGLEVASVTVARPSLDDVYLRFAGRTFGAAEADDRRNRATEGGIR